MMLRTVRCVTFIGLLWSVFAVAFATGTVTAAPLGGDFVVADPSVSLTPKQRTAARALGEATRFARLGKTKEARAALEQVVGVDSLAGYTELVRVHALMKEGRASEAHRVASRAIESSENDALRAALGVLQGEALAMSGDSGGAELAWNAVLGRPGAEDEFVRNSIQLAIVASRQRTGTLSAEIDPRILLDREFEDVSVSTSEVPISALPPEVALARATSAYEAGRAERSIPFFDRAIAGKLGEEEKRVARMGRGHALFSARRYEEAMQSFSELLPDVEARFWRARSLARLDRVDASLEEFERVTRDGSDEFASWSLFLMGTLYEDRGASAKAIDAFRRAAAYEAFPDRARAALWRGGWARFRSGAHADARETFLDLALRLEDPVARLRPQYWSARAAWLAGQEEVGRAELEEIARRFPLTYYGWRAQERLMLAPEGLLESKIDLAEGTRQVDDEAIQRITLLIEAELEELARDELRFAAGRARGYVDRVRVGVLLARVGDYHRANRLVVDAYSDSLARGLQPGREALWWLSWPPAYREMIEEVFPVGASIEPELVWAIMREESHYRADARSVVGALGLLQLMPATAEQLASEKGLEDFEAEDLFDPKTNITLGSVYLAQLGGRFDGRVSAAIGSYNAGPSKVSAWLRGEGGRLEDDIWVEDIPYDQTRGYVKRVLRSLHVYKAFYGRN
jgi:tetratricopeptide (TPR) repeat protein